MTEIFEVRHLPQADPATVEKIRKACRIYGPVAQGIASAMSIARAAAKAGVIKPGVERWPVKTGTDQDVAKVKKVIVPATVEEMNTIARPAGMPDPTKIVNAFQNKRAAPTETTIWQVDCTLTVIKLEQDGDYHLVVQGASGRTMIAEIPTPDPPFVAATSPFVSGIRRSRAAIDQKFGKVFAGTNFLPMVKPENKNQVIFVPVEAFSSLPPGAKPITFTATPGTVFQLTVKPTKVRLTGVGFFDTTHGQTGVAPNGIELHPVLDVKFL